MATILFTWELGAGIGHLMQMAPLAKPLAAKGHRVYLAGKDLAAAERIFADSNVQCLAAPPRGNATWPLFPTIHSYAHLLNNIGFGDDAYLASSTAAWKELYRQIRPDVIILDHSPTALLATRGESARRALIGAGFTIPPDVFPFPNLRVLHPIDEQRLRDDEEVLLQRVDALLQSWNQPALARLGQLFSQVDEIFLETYPQLDHYPNRGQARYYGPVNAGIEGGKQPVWTDVPGKKIFAYVRDFPELPHLLQTLRDAGLPTLIYADGIDARIQSPFAGGAVRFEIQRLNMEQAALGCDVAITHAGMGTTSMMLRAGKPLLLFPQVVEQGILAKRVSELGAGISVLPKQSAKIEPALRELIGNPSYAQAALDLSKVLAEFDLTEQAQAILRRFEQLL